MRETGILMPVSALPSRTGIGELGPEVYHLLELLEENGVKIWQILPLNPVGYGNSPYQPYSSCAGDEIYISLELLYEQGLLKEKPKDFKEQAGSVEYEAVRAFKEPFLRSAYEEFLKQGRDQEEPYQEFISEEWVSEYSVFRAMKSENNMVCWNEWPKEQMEWPEKKTALSKEFLEEVSYQVFLQYVFYCQWMAVKAFANEKGIRIMGDVPFYVGVDSVDVWGSKKNFLLDVDGRPIFIAGVPPDYFSATGQRWGNPIYDWDYLKEQNYQFWVDRIGYSSRLFDIVRIDHFRAFDTYWKIPASCPTAIEGEWIEAPGYEVLDWLMEAIPGVNLVAEDLGDLRPEVLELKNHYHLKGMKILQFSVDTQGKYARDNFHDVENMIMYTGTHDNDTMMEWYQKMNQASRRKVRKLLARQGFSQGSIRDRLLAYTLKSPAEYAVIPLWDILGLGREGHMNTPGTVGSPNWEWRLKGWEEAERELRRCRKMIVNR